VETSWITRESVIRQRPTVCIASHEGVEQLLGIKTATSTAYHPQTDGQTERVNQEIEQYLHLYIDHRQTNWVSWLSMAEFAYNNRVQVSTTFSPFQLNSGLNPRLGFEPRKTTNIQSVEDFVSGMKKARDDASLALQKAAEDMKKYYDAHHSPSPVYAVGERSGSTERPPYRKTDEKARSQRFGPFEISEVIGNNSYRLKLPTSMKIHPVFHAVRLRPFIAPLPSQSSSSPPPPIINHDGEEEFEVAEILDSRHHRVSFNISLPGKDIPLNTIHGNPLPL